MLRLLIVLLLSLLMPSMASLYPWHVAWAQESTVTSNAVELLARLRNLHLLADGLIARASSGRAPAQEFQLQARIYREQLRQTMLANNELVSSQQLPKDLLLDMVRMSALLYAAADCKSGLVIVCPPDLLRQLHVQQASVKTSLKTFTATGGVHHD
ncbi:hypothetical protein [Kaarinaea lacus]